MNLYRVFIMLLILLCITLGCQNQHNKHFMEAEQTMVGYVILKRENQAILIPNEKADAKDLKILVKKRLLRSIDRI